MNQVSYDGEPKEYTRVGEFFSSLFHWYERYQAIVEVESPMLFVVFVAQLFGGRLTRLQNT